MVKVKDLPIFDVAEVLDTPQMQAEYLAVALEEGTPEEIRNAIKAVARARGMTDTAKAAGITREGLYKALGDNGNPEFATVLAILRGMGVTLTAKDMPKKRSAKKRAKAA